jgi:membrane-associated HD superfamily phosphohydrolase
MPANAGIHDFGKLSKKHFFFENKKQKTSGRAARD